jgi:hypothetical protein
LLHAGGGNVFGFRDGDIRNRPVLQQGGVIDAKLIQIFTTAVSERKSHSLPEHFVFLTLWLRMRWQTVISSDQKFKTRFIQPEWTGSARIVSPDTMRCLHG